MACRLVGAKPLSKPMLEYYINRKNFCEILSKIHTFSFKKMHLKIFSAKRRPFCLGLNVLRRLPDLSKAASIQVSDMKRLKEKASTCNAYVKGQWCSQKSISYQLYTEFCISVALYGNDPVTSNRDMVFKGTISLHKQTSRTHKYVVKENLLFPERWHKETATQIPVAKPLWSTCRIIQNIFQSLQCNTVKWV